MIFSTHQIIQNNLLISKSFTSSHQSSKVPQTLQSHECLGIPTGTSCTCHAHLPKLSSCNRCELYGLSSDVSTFQSNCCPSEIFLFSSRKLHLIASRYPRHFCFKPTLCGHNAPGKDKDHHLGYRSLTSLRFLPSHGPSPTCPTGPASDFPQSPACVPPSGAGCGGGGSSALSWKQESLGFLGWSISGAEAGAVQLCLESSCIILSAKEGPESTLWSSSVNGQWIPTGHTHFTSFCPPNTSKCFPPPITPQVRFFCPSVKLPRGLASQFVLLAIALLCSTGRGTLFPALWLLLLDCAFWLHHPEHLHDQECWMQLSIQAWGTPHMRYAPPAPVIRASPEMEGDLDGSCPPGFSAQSGKKTIIMIFLLDHSPKDPPHPFPAFPWESEVMGEWRLGKQVQLAWAT